MASENLAPSFVETNRDGIDLMRPALFMPVLAEMIQEELMFFSHDMNGKITYVSQSAVSVLQASPNLILDRSLAELLTEDSCNDTIRSYEWTPASPSAATSGVCVVRGLSENAPPVKLKYWRVHVLHRDKPIGVSGILRRLESTETQQFQDSTNEDELMARVAALTPVEFQVIDMVVDGHMNKESAAILNVAVRTIESRRSRAMAKLKTNGLSELVQTWVQVRRFMSSNKYQQLGKFKGYEAKSSPPN